MSDVHGYRVLGGVLRSELPFPELPGDASPDADWTLRVRHAMPEPLADAVTVGVEPLVSGVEARLARDATRYRLTIDDTGTFDVSRDGAALEWTPAPDAPMELARLDVIGRVLAIASHAAGDYCLHASAVVVDGRAIAFVAPKGHGKSTLAMALVRGGARLLTDDTLRVVVRDDGPVALPGVHGLRLRADAAARLAGDDATAAASLDKLVVTRFAPDALATTGAPLAAVYVLAPARAEAAATIAVRERLDPFTSALALVGHAKLGTLLGRDEGGRVLALASRITRAAPVATLRIGRDLARVEEAARTVADWHRGASLASG